MEDLQTRLVGQISELPEDGGRLREPIIQRRAQRVHPDAFSEVLGYSSSASSTASAKLSVTQAVWKYLI